MKLRVFCAALFVVCSVPSFAYVYLYDDGVTDTSISTSGPATFNVAYLTQFTAVSGANTITSLDVVWGDRFAGNLPNGLSADVFLMSDPNGDGDPNDGALLQTVTTTTTNVGSDTFNSYGITATTINVGDNFFVGAFLRDVPTGSSWAGIDGNATGMASRNWWNVVVPSPVGSYIPLAVFGPDFTFMLRANSAVPEPATLAALGIGAAAMIRRRKRS